MSRWAQFLVSSGDNEKILLHIADIALSLDRVRDESVDVETARSVSSIESLNLEVTSCNQSIRGLEEELRKRLQIDQRAIKQSAA